MFVLEPNVNIVYARDLNGHVTCSVGSDYPGGASVAQSVRALSECNDLSPRQTHAGLFLSATGI